MKYTTYNTLDFAMDEFFQTWVLAPTWESEQFWQNWMEAHPEKKTTVEEAKALVQVYHVEEKELSAATIEQVLDGIKQGIKEEPTSKLKITRNVSSSNSLHFLHKWNKIAAVFIGFLIVAGTVGWILFNHETSHTTAYGEVEDIILPDGSRVTLNGNSTLRYPNRWQDGDAREVWLEGEAFFHVQNINQHATLSNSALPDEYKFIVHTHDLNIIVLGTQFNVNNRNDQVKVVLNSGKVKIKVPQVASKNEIFMEPGEMVDYDIKRKTIGKVAVDPKTYSSWRDNYMVFDDVPLHEVATILEDTYGLQITFENEALSQEIIRGTVPSDDISILLESLSQIFDLQITREKNKISIAKK